MVFFAAFGAADRVYFKVNILYAEKSEYFVCERDNLCICGRRSCAEALNAELVEFAQSACLRLFIAVARGEVANLLRQRLVLKSVLQKGSCRT